MHLADDLAAERAVKGDNRVLVLGEDGCFDAHKRDDGGETEEERACDHEDECDDETDSEARELGTGVCGNVFLVKLVQAHEHCDAAGEVQADVWHCGLDGGGESERLPLRLGHEAGAEGLVGRHGHDLVGPCCVDVCDGRAA